MPSSTSSFNDRLATRAIAVLLAMMVAYFLALELAMSSIIPRFSNSAKREMADFAAARSVGSVDGQPQVLLIGNSLLLHGVDRQLLRAPLDPVAQSAFLPVENTSFLDWYYGLRRLFAEGARPATVVLSINVRQLMSNSTNGEAFARRMMRRGDILEVRRDANLDNTTASAYFFATFSEWLGSRGGFRNWLLEQWLPDAGELVLQFASQPPAAPIAEQAVRDVALPRLEMLRQLCKTYGAAFIFVLPATTNVGEPAAMLQSASPGLNVPILVPFAPGEMPSAMFGDGFHLNPEGAKRFTERLAPMLRDVVAAVTSDQRLRATALGEKTGG